MVQLQERLAGNGPPNAAHQHPIHVSQPVGGLGIPPGAIGQITPRMAEPEAQQLFQTGELRPPGPLIRQDVFQRSGARGQRLSAPKTAVVLRYE
jgi:hypothetical protein